MLDARFAKYLPLGAAVLLLALGIARWRRRMQPRSFREDPIGALKDRSEVFASRAQEATEEALVRLQEALDEISGHLPDINRKQLEKRRKDVNKRLLSLSEQAQELLKELRSNGVFSR